MTDDVKDQNNGEINYVDWPPEVYVVSSCYCVEEAFYSDEYAVCRYYGGELPSDVIDGCDLDEDKTETNNPDQYYGYVIGEPSRWFIYTLGNGQKVAISVISRKPNNIIGKCIGPVYNHIADLQ